MLLGTCSTFCGLPQYDLRHSILKTQRCNFFFFVRFALYILIKIVSTGTKPYLNSQHMNIYIYFFYLTAQIKFQRKNIFLKISNEYLTFEIMFLQVHISLSVI